LRAVRHPQGFLKKIKYGQVINMIEFFIISGFFNAIAFSAIFIFVLLSGPRKKINQLYALFSLAMAVWGIGYISWLEANDYGSALFWTQVVNLCAILIPLFFAHWLLAALGIDGKKESKTFLVFSYLASLFFVAFSFQPQYIGGLRKALFFEYWPIPGVLHPYFLAVCWGAIIWYPVWKLYKAYRSAEGHKRQQLKYLLLTVAIGFFGGETNFLLWYGVPVLPWANITMFLWGLVFVYIVFRYRFIDFSLILGRVGIYCSAAFFVILYIWAFLQAGKNFNLEDHVFLAEALLVFGAIFLFNFLERSFEKISGRYFYYTYYNLRQKTDLLGKKINQMINIKELSDFIAGSLSEALTAKKTGLILRDFDSKDFYAQRLVDLSDKEIGEFLSSQKKFLESWFKKTGRTLLKDEIGLFAGQQGKDRSEEEKKDLSLLDREMEKIGAAALVPFLVKEDLVGFMILGQRSNGRFYSSQELDLLGSFAAQASVALNNSLSYAELAKRKNELELFNKLAVNRELKMIEMKAKMRQMEHKEEFKI